MSARVANFKQSDLKRAVKGAQSAGLRIGRIEIDATGKIVIIPDMGPMVAASNSWDRVLG